MVFPFIDNEECVKIKDNVYLKKICMKEELGYYEVLYRARIDRDSRLWNEWNAYCKIESTPKQLKDLEKMNFQNDELVKLWKEHEDFVNSKKLKK